MSFAGVLFLIGPLGAVVLVPLSLVAVRGRGGLLSAAAWVVAAGTVIAWLASWLLSFGDVSFGNPAAPSSAGGGATPGLATEVCAGGVILLAAMAGWALVTARRGRTARR